MVSKNLIFEFDVNIISTFKKLDIMTVIFEKFQNEKELRIERKFIHIGKNLTKIQLWTKILNVFRLCKKPSLLIRCNFVILFQLLKITTPF